MMTHYLKFMLCCIALFCFLNSKAQTYLGLSANLGNQLHFTPDSEGLRRPPAFSGSLVIRVQEELRNDWVLQQGGGLGVLGFNLKVVAIDTIMSQEPEPAVSKFFEYSIFYANLDLLLGKRISIGKKKLTVGLGGGITYYFPPAYLSYGVSVGDIDQPTQQLFNAEVDTPSNKLVAFVKIGTQLTLTRSLAVGLEYSYHFKTVAEGYYEFYHTQTPSAGKISLYQREFNFIFFVKLPKYKSDW